MIRAGATEKLDERVLFVTGASSGIGEALARRAAREPGGGGAPGAAARHYPPKPWPAG